MIVSKGNLQCVLVAKNDQIPVLNNVCLQNDGSTIGSNGKVIMVVEPVSKKMRNNFPIKESGDAEEIVISADTIGEVLKNIPKDSQFGGILEHCNIEADSEKDDQVLITMTDGKRQKYLTGKRWMRRYLDFREWFKRFSSRKKSVKVVLNRKRLLSLLTAIEKACPDGSGVSPVYIEFSEDNDIVLRAINYSTGQRVVCCMQSYKGIEGKWLEPNEWEQGLYDGRSESGKQNFDAVDDDSVRGSMHHFSAPCKIKKSNGKNQIGKGSRRVPPKIKKRTQEN